MRKQATGNRQHKRRGAHALPSIPHSLFPIPSFALSHFRAFAIAFVFCLAVTPTITAAPVADPFADVVVSYAPGPSQPGYANSSLALGAPVGGYVAEPNNTSIVTLGDGGNIVLAFNSPVIDDPRNPYGLDFTVFSNAQVYETTYGYERWQELAFVEISQGGSNWYLIKPSIFPANLRIDNGTGTDPHNYDVGESYTAVSGYAEYTPTVGLPQNLNYPPFPGVSRTDEELYTVPDRPSNIKNLGYTNEMRFDSVSGGGDTFDIANAVLETSPGVPLILNGQTLPAGIDWFNYVRLTDARTGDSSHRYGPITADIDAVSRTRPAISIGQLKASSPGDYGLITEAIVTATFPTEFFIESPDRSAAMRVGWDGAFLVDGARTVAVGDKITITGHLSKVNARFSFNDPMLSFTAVDTTLPKPVGVPIRNLDSDLVYGMTVRTWGKISDPGDGWEFVITEADKSVKVASLEYREPMTTSAYVSVTGICDREEGTGNTVLKVIDPPNDIVSYP